jgi:LPS sulfotransferase NodH
MSRYTELQISSELLDQPQFNGTPQKIIICSTPRSGSYLLCRHMINAGLGVPHEYFNPVVIGQIAPRLGLAESARGLQWWPRGRRDRLGLRRKQRAAEHAFLAKYLQALIPRRCQGRVFAAKIHFRDYRVLDSPLGHALLDGAVFVHLYREDLLKQAVSEHFAQLTGRWGIDDTVTTPPVARPEFYDAAAVGRILDDISEQDRRWRVFLARRGAAVLSMSYERLCLDPFGAVVAIASRVGIDPAALRHGYAEAAAPPECDRGLPNKGDVARRFLSAVAAAQEPPAPDRAAARIAGLFGA